MELARVGFAGVSVDGPLGGLRNESGWDEQFAIFNISNPPALRDNIRQSALELILFAHVVPELRVDAASCPGLSTPAGDGVVRFDPSTLTIMGHSMGAWIAPLVVGLEPAYRAMIVSGAGGSWIENVVHKQRPLEVRPLAETILRYRAGELNEQDPVLSLLQWAGEGADPQLFGGLVIDEAPSAGRHVLMFQGMLDTYIPPPVANALSLAIGLDLAGTELDVNYPEYRPLQSLLPFVGRSRIPYSVAGNRFAGTVTAIVTQHPEDGVEDGHEVMYQTEPPKRQYRCFLRSLIEGVPSVPDGAGDPATCD
ncbi:MAG: hypothetical protein K8H88_26465 [Sandaracinaceae bacterium]|nr:hypothetical protein [Sandaracinaceae bacterium]